MVVKGYPLWLILFVCLLAFGAINAESSLIISPENAVITAGGSITCQATDTVANADVTGLATWTINGGGSFAGNVFTGTMTGTFVITVSYDGTSATTAVTITPGSPISFGISPLNATVTAGGDVSYYATATDGYNNQWDVTGSTTFTASSNIFVGNSFGSFYAGTATVTASYQGMTVTTTVVVIHGSPKDLSISPVHVSITAGSPVTYYATATDYTNVNQWDVTNEATWTTTGGGSFVSWHVFMGTVAGTHIITAGYGGQATTTTITIDHAAPTTLSISPGTTTIIAGEKIEYHATATDLYSNSWDITNEAIFTTSGGGSFVSWHGFVGTVTGTYTVCAVYSGQTVTTTVIITPATPTTVSISPMSGIITAGSSTKYYATATDGYSNNWDVTGVATFTSTGGSMSGNLFTGTITGTYFIQVAYLGNTATATVTIDPAVPIGLSIAPKERTITAGDTVEYHATATDTYGNEWDAANAVAWTSSYAGNSPTGELFT
ncbi:hypothetical protein HY792_00230, partial [Candidatus Desantisbacteria bacterium]|nr:hypothetical protein [Candidatus Desantisbacteria bacterium]